MIASTCLSWSLQMEIKLNISSFCEVGDKVDLYKLISINCPTCDTTGTVTIKDKKFDCPNCHGDIIIKNYEKQSEGIVENISIDPDIINTFQPLTMDVKIDGIIVTFSQKLCLTIHEEWYLDKDDVRENWIVLKHGTDINTIHD
jgi:predicted RNA-binding Zn-ribbon protein involved in translation (DUF1610 family)